MEREVLAYLPASVRHVVTLAGTHVLDALEEIRLRAGMPLILMTSDRESMFTPDGSPTTCESEAYFVSRSEVERVVQAISGSSLYAVEHELRNGYLSVPGGHRVGICGVATPGEDGIRTLKSISSLNFRIARQVRGAADGLIPYVVRKGLLLDTLIISPPQAGKTTALRDLVRQASAGNPRLGLNPHKVGVVDERGEIAGCADGQPQNDVGPRTDVLDGCPKPQGVQMLIRTMSPTVVATDEIGTEDDMAAIAEAQKAGVVVVATVHSDGLEALMRRRIMRGTLEERVFSRYVVLSRRKGPGTLEGVYMEDGRLHEASRGCD